MTEKEHATGRRRYRSREEADELAAEFETSGLRRREFCERRNVALNTLSRYVKRHREQWAAAAVEPHWVTVKVAEAETAGSGLRVALGGNRRIEVERGFDAATLVQLVTTLERF